MSTADAGRLVCTHCGANNFNTQAACWKCGASLAGGMSSPAPAAYTPTPTRPGTPVSAPAPIASPASALDRGRSSNSVVDPAIAVWSGIALALLFPVFAVPVGIVFLMLDDRRRIEIGRITLIWGIVGTILQTIATGILMRGVVDEVRSFIPAFRATGHAQPGANDVIPSSDLPAGFR